MSYGTVAIAIDEPVTPPQTLLAASDPSFEVVDLAVISRCGSAATVSDIFLDVAHFFFVHAVTFGADKFCEVPTYSGKRNDIGFRATYEHEFLNREDVGGGQGIRPLLQRRRRTHRYNAPLRLEFEIEFSTSAVPK